MGKVKGAMLCLLLAVTLGGIGVAATWVAGKTLWDVQRARDWVRVRVDVVPGQFDAKPRGPGSGHFAYSLGGQRFEGRRLEFGGLGGNDDIDAWRAEMADELQAARAAGQSVSLWVNPDNPAESVLDRGMRWHESILLGLLALGFGGTGLGALVSALKIALGDVSAGSAPNAGGGAGFLWIFASIWNAMSFVIAWLALAEIIESREWPGLFVLLFPAVGVLLLWGAATSTVSGIRARVARSSGRNVRPASPSRAVRERGSARPAEGGFAAQAALAMFDPRDISSRSEAPRSVELPASVAKLSEEGGVLTVRFSRRRWLAPALILFAIGGVLTLVGLFMVFDGGIGPGVVILLTIAAAADVGGVALLAGSLVVRARAGEISVEKGGLFGSKAWQLRRETIKEIRPVLSYTVHNDHYFTIRAETQSGERVVLGDSLGGEALAESYAGRLARAAGFPSSLVRACAYSSTAET